MAKFSLDLTGQWQFREYPVLARRARDLDSYDWLETLVPCSIYNSLIDSGQIDLTEIRTHPDRFEWVSDKPWIYRKSFDVPARIDEFDRFELVFDGLDTISKIWLNEKKIADTSNMFVSYRFDVTEHIKSGDNILMVKFESSVDHAKKLMKKYTIFDEKSFNAPHRVYIRKAQYQFGWDWGPALPGCGIWKSVRLEAVKYNRIEDVRVRTIDCGKTCADISVEVTLDRPAVQDCIGKILITEHGQHTEYVMEFKAGERSHSAVLRIENPLLWWPHGYGCQYLYNIKADLIFGDDIIDSTKLKFGIRTIKVDCSNDDIGQKFQFEVNGVPVYIRGADWIPDSIFAGQTRREDYVSLLNSTVEANMNMLRIWGGGYYANDDFYEICDELGILVWQDFMFACAYYPDRQWFLKEIEIEAVNNIKRIRNHASLALWCGNNEIDWQHSGSSYGKNKKFHGMAIYHKLLPGILSELDPDRTYIPSTPFSPGKTPNDNNSGTIHNWQVWSGGSPVRDYLCDADDIPRFVSEFGMQGLPSRETIRTFCPDDKMYIGSSIIEKHEYQPSGESLLFRYIGEMFGSAKTFDDFIYLSQLTQARGVKSYVEHLRGHNYRNSGVIFWQFNDCCPSLSWAAIDYLKKPKALYYYARRFYSDRIICVIPRYVSRGMFYPSFIDSMEAVIVNDSFEPLTAVLSCTLMDLKGCDLDKVSFPVAIGQLSSSAPIKMPRGIVSPKDTENAVLHLELSNDGEVITESIFLYEFDKYINWPKAEIRKKFSNISERTWILELSCDVIARDVCIETDISAELSDNFIDLLPGRPRQVTVRFGQKVKDPAAVIRLRSLDNAFGAK